MMKTVKIMTISGASSFRQERKGFTLVEILVVMAILAILASLMIVGMDASRKKARITKAHAESKQLIQAWKSYWLVYGKWPASCEGQSDAQMDSTTMKFLMGDNPKKLPFFEPNEQVSLVGFKDPWGNLYTVDFKASTKLTDTETYQTTVFLPQCRRYVYDNN